MPNHTVLLSPKGTRQVLGLYLQFTRGTSKYLICLLGGLANLLLVYTQVQDADPAGVSEVGPGLEARAHLLQVRPRPP